VDDEVPPPVPWPPVFWLGAEEQEAAAAPMRQESPKTDKSAATAGEKEREERRRMGASSEGPRLTRTLSDRAHVVGRVYHRSGMHTEEPSAATTPTIAPPSMGPPSSLGPASMGPPSSLGPPASLAAPDSVVAPSSKGTALLGGYDQIHYATARIFRPQDEGELRALLRKLYREPARHRLTFRAGGQAIDAQAINDDIVIVLEAPELKHIGEPKRDAKGWYITVGAAAPWGEILKKTAEKGLVPYSVVTTAHATAGGTAAADCLSRCSPISGKEGAHIRSFKLITATGRRIVCKRGDRDPDRAALFRAVIGGFGYLGVITEITFDLRPPLPGWRPGRKIRVATRVDKAVIGAVLGKPWSRLLPSLREQHAPAAIAEGQDGLLDRLLHLGQPQAQGTVAWDAVSSGAWYALGQIEALLFRSRYVLDREVHPMPLHARASALLDVLCRGMIEPSLTELAEGAMFLVYPAGVYVDELDDFTFFMENQMTPAREAARNNGWRLNSVQQTFVLPAIPAPGDAEGVWPTARFLDLIRPTMFDEPDAPSLLDPMRPTLIDVLYLPPDEFLLSSTRRMGGYAVTLSFAERNGSHWDKLRARLRQLSKRCLELGGRVHLVKNVEVEPEDLWKMYGDAFDEFLALKERLDPKGVIGNEFFDRIFHARRRPVA
jgi:decaprenylphospho-beta-D-ribofuranose 2-oxidase